MISKCRIESTIGIGLCLCSLRVDVLFFIIVLAVVIISLSYYPNRQEWELSIVSIRLCSFSVSELPK